MFDYVENRVLCLGGVLHGIPSTAALDEALVAAGLDAVLEASVIDGPVHERSQRQRAIAFTLKEAARARACDVIRNHTSKMTLTHARLRIIPPGYANLIMIYAVDDDVPIERVEELGDVMAELADAGLPDLGRLVAELQAAGLVSETALGRLGVPVSLERQHLHHAEQAYTYNQHVFFSQPEAFAAAVTHLADDAPRFEYRDHMIAMSWAISLWKVESPLSAEAIVDLLMVNTFGLMESTTLDNATNCTAAFLGLAARGTLPDAKEARAVHVEHELLLTTLALWRRNLEDRPRRYLEIHAAQSYFPDKHALLRRSEETLRFAVEGLERELAGRSQRLTQLILAVLTTMTLYSVGNDILAIMQITSLEGLALLSIPTLALGTITLAVILFILLFGRHLRGP